MIQEIFRKYRQFSERSITDRFTKHRHLVQLLEDLPPGFSSSVAGYSKEGRSIHLITCGKGPIRVMLWSQMHGDEATGTMAIFDLLNCISQEDAEDRLLNNCTLYFIPMLNPDGAERFTRRNAQQIDINRDYLQKATPEGRLLIDLQARIKPDFGFNLHDQSTLWSVKGTAKPASLSFLAPVYNKVLEINDTRERAMKVIAEIFAELQPHLDGQIGLFGDEYEARAFGDNFQHKGTSTILIEAGGMLNDPEKQQLRAYYFLALLTGLRSIAQKTFKSQSTAGYFLIPPNVKEIFHILIRNVQVDDFTTSIGLNYTERPAEDGLSTARYYNVEDIGDLSGWSAYETIDSEGLKIVGKLVFDEAANFDLLDGAEIILSFKSGILHSKR